MARLGQLKAISMGFLIATWLNGIGLVFNFSKEKLHISESIAFLTHFYAILGERGKGTERTNLQISPMRPNGQLNDNESESSHYCICRYKGTESLNTRIPHMTITSIGQAIKADLYPLSNLSPFLTILG